ncbi:uncharacterized protein C8A04DRAFT_28891 [Dichotomopilus funicola]|uniref:Cytochrome c oxidase assembly protein COX20, mitochondrial n=1 Tax=Dichotomopilus funicola TaxID=1934379 RepID=A0AAN6V2V7_9PEZI|nr:hypothetical protein C8A04DRAFT_28891 [Dichotomopilus funicola]
MSTSQPPTRSELPADPNRSWIQQPTTPSTTSPQPPQPPPPTEQSLTDGSQPASTRPRPRPPTISEAAQTIKPADFLTFHQAPCARTGLLTGIGAGAAIGAVRWIMGLPIPRAANWAVGSGVLAAVGQYEYCQLRRMQEREKVKRVVEVHAAKRAKEKKEEDERKRAVEAEGARKIEAEKEKGRGWRLW